MRTIQILMLTLALSFAGCKTEINQKAPPKGLDVSRLEQGIATTFNGNVVGYGWSIYRNGELLSSGGNGFARGQGETEPTPYTANTIGTVFSTSKTITAAAFVDNMAAWGISLDDSIFNYLPKDWRKHESLRPITFKHLLRHTSGLVGTLDTYAQMKDFIENTGINGTLGVRTYANINYTLFRVIIPNILDQNGLSAAIANGEQAAIDFCANLYENFVSTKMAKAGMPGFEFINTYYLDVQPRTLYYDFNTYKSNPLSASGGEMFDCHDISGAGGWFMNPVQYCAFIDGFFNGKLVDATDLETMKNQSLGMYTQPGKYGPYYAHNGGGSWNGVGGQCIWMHFPVANVSLFIMWNSLNPDFDGATKGAPTISDIFDQAYNP